MNKLLSSLSSFRSSAQLLSRGYAFKSDLKIKWVRPERILCIKPQKSGDKSGLPDIDKSTVMLEFQNSKELQTADENVQKLFQLGYNRRKKTTELYTSSLVDTVKRHDLDLGSMESKLADMTANIRSLQVYMEEFPRNKRSQVHLKELIDKRKRFLRILRRWDYKRFEWILEKLDLVYKAYPSEYHWITRRDSLRKLTDLHCNGIREERLNAYRQKLENQQIDFLSNKLSNLEFIRKEQIECSLPVTITPEQIKEVKSKYTELVNKRAEQLAAVEESATQTVKQLRK